MTEREDRHRLFSVMLEDIGKKEDQIQVLKRELANAQETIKAMHDLIICAFEGEITCRYPVIQAWIENISPRQRFHPKITALIKEIAKEDVA
jgi:hypothetical protein